MTKNKSLFSGVGDGNRVKSIRLQGDKHTQGKKGKRRAVNAAKAGPNREPRQPARAWQPEPELGLRGRGKAGQRRGGAWDAEVGGVWDHWPSCSTKPQPRQRPLAEATTGTERPGQLLLPSTSLLGPVLLVSGQAARTPVPGSAAPWDTGCCGLECSGKFPLAKPKPTTQGLCYPRVRLQSHRGSRSLFPLVPHQTDNRSGDLEASPLPSLLLPPLSDWQAGAAVPGENKGSEEDPRV